MDDGGHGKSEYQEASGVPQHETPIVPVDRVYGTQWRESLAGRDSERRDGRAVIRGSRGSKAGTCMQGLR